MCTKTSHDMGVSAWCGSEPGWVFCGVSRVHGYGLKTVYGTDWWTRVMGQSPNESHGFETNGNKYKCVGHSKMGPIPPPPPRVKDPNVIHG